jgi:hypothetical protein
MGSTVGARAAGKNRLAEMALSQPFLAAPVDGGQPSSCVDAGATVVHVPTGRRDSASWQALCLALLGVALPAIAFIPDFVQEVFTVIVLALAGGAVAVFALTQGIGAFRARRAAHESPAIAATAIAISILPMLGALLLLPSLSCYMGEGCGGG